MPPSKRAVKLTREQAREMQDLLIAGYEAEEFQKKLHMIWFITDDHVTRVRRRQELCLEVQGPIIAKFGYEPTRKGVAESVAAFNAPELLFDAEIQEYNRSLGYLVNPDAQLGSTGAENEAVPPAAEGPPLASQANATPPPGQRKEAPAELPRPAPAAPKRPLHQERPPEQQFMLKFHLGPPGGFISQSVELTEDAAISMLDELIAGFSNSDFQQQLRGVYAQAGNNPRKLSALRQELTMKIQIPIVAKYGFEASFDGVLCSAKAFTPELQKNPELAQKNCLVFWLIDPVAQAHTPVPTGPATMALYVTLRAHNESGLLCSLSMEMSSNVKSVKESIQLKAGIPLEGQKLFVIEHVELEDGVPLSRLIHVGGTLDVWVARRPDHVVEWLKKVHRAGADALQGAPASLLGDLEFLLPAFRMQVRVLHYADASIRSCRELLLKFVQHSGQALQFAASELQADHEVVRAAVQQDGWALQFASVELQANRDIVLAAVSEDGWAFQFASAALRADRDIVLKAASKDAWIIGNAAPELRNDREVVLTAVKQDWRVLEAIEPALRGDREVMMSAVKQDGWALEFAPAQLQGDRELVFEAVRRTGEALRFAAKKLCSDRELCMAAVTKSGCSLALVAPEIQDVELVLAAAKQDPRALQFVEPRLRDAVKAELGISHVPAWDSRRPGGAAPAGFGRGPDTSESGRWVLPTLKKHFDLLGLHEGSKPEEIKKKYKVLALKHHPDKHPQDPEGAKAKFQAINNAFQAIKEALGL